LRITSQSSYLTLTEDDVSALPLSPPDGDLRQFL
jgi:hypothetical protein